MQMPALPLSDVERAYDTTESPPFLAGQTPGRNYFYLPTRSLSYSERNL